MRNLLSESSDNCLAEKPGNLSLAYCLTFKKRIFRFSNKSSFVVKRENFFQKVLLRQRFFIPDVQTF